MHDCSSAKEVKLLVEVMADTEIPPFAAKRNHVINEEWHEKIERIARMSTTGT